MLESIRSTASEGRARSTALKRGALGVFGIAFLIVSAASPLGYLAGFGPLTLLVGGPGAAMGFVAGGLALAIFLAAFTAMTPYVKNSGAFYAYVTAGLGRPVGAACAIFAVAAYNLALIGALGGIATYLGPHLSALVGSDVPWPLIAAFVTLAVFGVAAGGIDIGARFLGFLLAAETAVITVVVVAIVVEGGASGLSFEAFSVESWTAPGMGAALAMTLVGFLGIEGAALYRSESRNPERTIPRAAFLAVGTMAAFYTIVTWAVVQGFGTSEVQRSAEEHGAFLFFVAADQYVGSWAATAMNWLIITSLLAAQLAFHNAGNRYVHSLARDGLFPRSLAITSRRSRAPWVAGLAATLVSLVGVGVSTIVGWDPYFEMSVWLLSIAVVLILALQLATCAAVIAFFSRNKHLRGSRRGVICAVVALVLLAIAAYQLLSQFELLTASGPEQNGTILATLAAFMALTVIAIGMLTKWRSATLAGVGQEQAENANIETTA